MTVEVLCEYTPAGQFLPAEVEYLNHEISDEDKEAVPALIPALRKWAEDEVFCTGAFGKEALIEARKQGLDKYDEQAASRFDGFSRTACGYR
jgi:hypothetical protein